MKERPILFSAPMVRALLDGTKTQTRRVVKHPAPDGKSGWHPITTGWQFLPGGSERPVCPYGKPGDRLWVRETWQGPLLQEFEMDADADWHRPSRIHQYQNPAHCVYAADGGPRPEWTDLDENQRSGWRPSIHMPRWASRIDLEITGVRVERLLDISEADAIAEGVEPLTDPGAVFRPAASAYSDLWEQINGAGSWAANPWVWAVSFKVVRP